MRISSLRLGVLLLGALTAPAWAQMPGPPGAVCLCMKQSVDAANADMSAKNSALGAARAELDGIDQQLAAARAGVNVDNPQAVAQFRQLLEQRDATAKRAGGSALTDAQAASARYNEAVAAYNNQCAGRPLPPPPPGPLSCPMP